jgi:hypothetical protein
LGPRSARSGSRHRSSTPSTTTNSSAGLFWPGWPASATQPTELKTPGAFATEPGAQFGRYAQCCRRFGEPESGEEQVWGQRGPETRSELTPGPASQAMTLSPVSDDRAGVDEDMSARPATAATPQPSLSLAKSRRSKTPECLLAGRELGASKRGTRSRPLRRIASDATAHRPETAVNADSAWLLASRDLRRQQVGAGRTALGATRATQAGPTDDCWVAKPEAPCGAAGSDRDDRFVANAIVRSGGVA